MSAKPLVEKAVMVPSQNEIHVQTSVCATAPAATISEGVMANFRQSRRTQWMLGAVQKMDKSEGGI